MTSWMFSSGFSKACWITSGTLKTNSINCVDMAAFRLSNSSYCFANDHQDKSEKSTKVRVKRMAKCDSQSKTLLIVLIKIRRRGWMVVAAMMRMVIHTASITI